MIIKIENIEDTNDLVWVFGINWNNPAKGECWHMEWKPF